MNCDDIDALKAKWLCHDCIGDSYFSAQVEAHGKHRKCSYCGKASRSFMIGDVADSIEAAFEKHYTRTSDQPNSWQYSLLRDNESDYDWYRDGEPVVYAIMNSAEIPESAARDVQKVLEDRYADFEADKMGEETEFSSQSYYEEKGADDQAWQSEWSFFELSLKTEARFFSRTAAKHLASVFNGIATMRTHDEKPLIVEAGPDTAFHSIYRARVFQSNDKLEVALCRPDLHLGPPPAALAAAGRMNARGISVFYGTNDQKVAIAEVRPPVGSQVAVAQFEILRPLRLLDLTALNEIRITGSIFDPEFAGQLEHATFLRSLSQHMTRPVMPDDEAFEYLPTQAVADFLATEAEVPLDGILFPSVQAAGGVLNVVLFHKAASVETLEFPDGTCLKAETGHSGEDGWEYDYSVIEEVPPETKSALVEEERRASWPADLGSLIQVPQRSYDLDPRTPTLRIVLKSIHVHIVNEVKFETDSHIVRRHRWEKRRPDF